MDFARRQRDPTRHLIGIAVVILVHVIVIYGLVTGLARKAVEVIKKPLSATIVEEIKAPPPDIPVPTTPSEPVIAAITPTPPPAPPVIAPPPPPAPPAPPPKPEIVRNIAPISKTELEYPREAQRRQIEGTVLVHVSIDEKGNVTDVKVIEAKPPQSLRYFEQPTKSTLMQWKFAATGQKFIGEIE